MDIYRKINFYERKPLINGRYDTDRGYLHSKDMVLHGVVWWFEPIEIPSADHLGEMANSEAWKMNLGLSESNSYETGYWEGANYCLNYLNK